MTRKQRWYVLCGVGMAALVYGVLLLHTTGVHISPDSIMYLDGYTTEFPRELWEGPRNQDTVVEKIIAETNGPVTRPINPFPPGTGVFFSVPMLFTADVSLGIGTLQILCFVLFACSFCALILFSTDRLWPAIAALGAVVFTWPFIEKFTWAWSEPLFVITQLGAFAALVIFCERDERKYLFLSCGAVTLGYLVRLPGLAAIPAGALTILFISKMEPVDRLSSSSWRSRLSDAAVFTLLSSIGFIIFLLYKKTAGISSGYPFHFFPETVPAAWHLIKDFFTTGLQKYIFFEPGGWAGRIFYDLMVTLFIAATLLILIYKRTARTLGSLLWILGLAGITLAGNIFLNVIGPARYQMPIYPFVLLFLIFGLTELQNKKWRFLSVSMLAVLLILPLPFKLRDIRPPYDSAVDLSVNTPEQKELLEKLVEIKKNPQTIVFSNDAHLAYRAYFHKKIIILPLPYTAFQLKKLFEKIPAASEPWILWNETTSGLPLFDVNLKKLITPDYGKEAFESIGGVETHMVLFR